MNIEISQAFSTTESASSRTSSFSAPSSIFFNAAKHHFVDNKDDTGIAPFSLKVPIGSNITLEGKAAESISNEIICETPDKNFESILIDPSKRVSAKLPTGTIIKVELILEIKGVYIVEVNDAAGSAVINTPVYVGDIYPFLPDFRDLSPRFFDRNAFGPTILSERRFLVLDMINTIRSKFGAEAVFMDDALNDLAQKHSQNMVSQNFFGHFDPQGNGPEDRARAAGIFESVG